MALVISTTGTTVQVPELGISIVHPTTNYQISDKFTSEDLKRANSLTAAILAGTLTWKKTLAGSTELAASYDPDHLELEEEYVGGQSSFGSYQYRVESLAESSNNSQENYATKLALTTDSLPLGDYVVLLRYRFRTSSANRGMTVRIQRDGVTAFDDFLYLNSVNETPRKTQYAEFLGISGAQTFTFQFAAGSPGLLSGTTAYISEAVMTLWRIK